MKPRYERECIKLGEMANEALNLPKNVDKPNFENLPIIIIFELLQDEIKELDNEIKEKIGNYICTKIRKGIKTITECDIHEINFKRAKEELSDCAAVLTGLLAWVNKQEEIQHGSP